MAKKSREAGNSPLVVAPHPFLKWAGGKRHLLPELLKRVPESFNTYYEPFLGGGALFFALQPKRAILSDVNDELVTTYQVVKSKVDNLLLRLRELERGHVKEGLKHYLKVREDSLSVEARVAVASRMIYLNKTCFNGLYRVNLEGKFNVPMGKFATPPLICDEANLRACSVALKGDVTVLCDDYKMALCVPDPGDFVYLDPPYLPRTSASFTKFTKEGFGLKEHIELAKWVRKLKERGVHILLSNAGTKTVRDLYPERFFKVEEVAGRRSISCHSDTREPVTEFLIS